MFGLHLAWGMFAASALSGGGDSPAEWTFYYASAGCLLLPFTATLARPLTGSAKMKRAGQGTFIGLTLATAMAMAKLAMFPATRGRGLGALEFGRSEPAST
ncbi:hypothetical protein [Micromonospora sp. RTP1Z1]|uniref:hypothetical protein n=1 Tax=Micromonospora sp. RTP1Z1 TaxID=2994043 RepID=UPI0029C94BB1|nr:hypothetical protein [Micromonospora sp. RTP1Z1]